MRSIVLGILGLIALTAVAEATQSRYIGMHPIARSEGRGFCYIEGPHVHLYPADKLQYRDHDGHHYFVGDPVAYGYEGPRYAYKGHHPIHVHAVLGDDHEDVEFCYLDGPHYHPFRPAVEAEFKVVGDTYFYVAPPPRPYVDARPAMIQINAMYTPLVYARPVVTVQAPVGWIGARVEFAAPAVVVEPPPRVVAPRAGIHVGAEVHIPIPSVHIGIGVGAPVVRERVYVRDRHYHHHGKYKHKHKRHKHWRH